MPEHRHRWFPGRIVDDLPALRQHRPAVQRQQADQVLAVGPRRVGPAVGAFADEVLALADGPAHADILGRHRAVGFLPDDNEALFRAQDVHGFGAVGCCAAADQRLPERKAVMRRYVDLVRGLAAETDPEDTGRRTEYGAGPDRHMGECLVRPVDVAVQARHQVACFRPRDGRGRPGFRYRGRKHPKIRPFGLQPQFEPVQHCGGVAGRRGHHIMVVGEPGGHAVVEDHAVFVAHQAVAGAADLQRLPVVGVDAVQQRNHVGALEIDLAER